MTTMTENDTDREDPKLARHRRIEHDQDQPERGDPGAVARRSGSKKVKQTPLASQQTLPFDATGVVDEVRALRDRANQFKAAIDELSTWVYMKMAIGKAPQQKKLSNRAMDSVASQFKCDVNAITAGTRLFSKADLEGPNAVLAEAKNAFCERVLTKATPEAGVRAVSTAYAAQLRETLSKLDAKLAVEAAKLAAQMPAIIENKKRELGDLFRPELYAFDPRSTYSLRITYVDPASKPEWTKLPAMKAMAEELADNKLDFYLSVIDLEEQRLADELFENLSELLDRFEEFDTKTETGRRRTLKQNRFANIVTVCEECAEQAKGAGLIRGPLVELTREIMEAFQGKSGDLTQQQLERLVESLRRDDALRGKWADKLLRFKNKLVDMPVMQFRRNIETDGE